MRFINTAGTLIGTLFTLAHLGCGESGSHIPTPPTTGSGGTESDTQPADTTPMGSSPSPSDTPSSTPPSSTPSNTMAEPPPAAGGNSTGAGGLAGMAGVGGMTETGGTAGSADGGTGGASAAAGGGGEGGSVEPAPEPELTLEEAQERFLSYRLGMFLHFNMSTFARQDFLTIGGEHEQGNEDEKLFNPTQYDPGQWLDAAQAAGMKYAVLTAKHHGGFCLWDSAVTEHDVASSNWKNGQGDAVKEFVDAARSRGIRVGFYYSVWDKHNGSDEDFIKSQLTELLTNYGPIDLLWMDGWGWKDGYEKLPYATIRDHIKSVQNNTLVVESNQRKKLENTEIVVFDGSYPNGNTDPAELAGNMRAGNKAPWFFHPEGNCNRRSVDALKTEFELAGNNNANYLLGVSPDDKGLVPQCQVDRLKEFGEAIAE